MVEYETNSAQLNKPKNKVIVKYIRIYHVSNCYLYTIYVYIFNPFYMYNQYEKYYSLAVF